MTIDYNNYMRIIHNYSFTTMAYKKTVHRRRRARSYRRKNVKSRKVMRGGEMSMAKCKAFVSNPANSERVANEKRDRGITGVGLLACNELVKTNVDFSVPYKPKSSSYPYQQPKPSKPKGPIVIDWGA